ncbi:hypothetical protein X975_00325, partial [Stegodyphus mimosarum]
MSPRIGNCQRYLLKKPKGKGKKRQSQNPKEVEYNPKRDRPESYTFRLLRWSRWLYSLRDILKNVYRKNRLLTWTSDNVDYFSTVSTLQL